LFGQAAHRIVYHIGEIFPNIAFFNEDNHMGWMQEQHDRIKGLLDKLTNDAHVPIAIGVFIATFTWVCKGHDLPPGFVSSLYAFYGFLGGHALVSPTVDVNVNNDNSNTNTASANAAPPAPDPSTGSSGAKG
jgi:hypothetical protein